MNKVLVVDDEQQLLDIIKQMLEKLGYKVYTALTATQALKLWKEHNIGIILSDLQLNTDMDGLSLCSRIRSEDLKTIMIAITGLIEHYTLDLCLTVGFRDVLPKPIRFEDLRSTMECAMIQRERWELLNY